jgi:FXSXX-COOH protein
MVLPDVSGLPLDRLIDAADTVLANSLRRLVADLDRPQEVLSAFDNYAGDPDDSRGEGA